MIQCKAGRLMAEACDLLREQLIPALGAEHIRLLDLREVDPIRRGLRDPILRAYLEDQSRMRSGCSKKGCMRRSRGKQARTASRGFSASERGGRVKSAG